MKVNGLFPRLARCVVPGFVILSIGLGNVGALTPQPSRTLTPLAVPPSADGPSVLGLPDLLRMTIERNPTLAQAGLEIDAARGRAVQAGLYPNPTVGLQGEEIGSRGGIHTLPIITQEIVTGGKLRLGRAVVDREVDQSFLALQRQRYTLFTTVRQDYFAVLATRSRINVLSELVSLANKTLENAQKLLEAKVIGELDVLQFEVERDRFRAELDAARQEEAAAWRRLAADVGVPDLAPQTLANALGTALPQYDFEDARSLVLEEHPEVRSARVGVTRAQLVLAREQAAAVPNITVGAGYQRNFNDRENQARYEVGLPIPLWNRNQGNVAAAQAELGRSIQEVSRVQNDLTSRLAAAFGRYAAARERAERYRTSILPNAQKAYRLAQEAFKGGQFEYLRVLQSQRAAAEANLEYLRAQSEAWQAAAEISGLMLEECWPLPAPHEQTKGDAPKP